MAVGRRAFPVTTCELLQARFGVGPEAGRGIGRHGGIRRTDIDAVRRGPYIAAHAMGFCQNSRY
jgi:hypothetical protein